MAFIAGKLSYINPSMTIALSTKAAELRAEGKEVISLGIGEPDFDTPDFVKDAAIEAMKAGQTKYTATDGTSELKEAIKLKFQRENEMDVSVQEISVGNGVKQVIFNALMATLDPQDEVLIPAPYWVSYPDIVILAGGKPKIVECGLSFKITPELLERHITPQTKWLLLNTPNNPTGAVYTAEELKALGEVVEKFPHLYVMSDDIYEHLIYDAAGFKTFAQVNPHLKDRVATLNGPSKSYAMTGWRIGYAAAPKTLVKAMAVIASQSTSCPCSISQAATVAAITGDQTILEKRRLDYQQRRDRLVSLINAIPGMTCDVPSGAFYLFANCEGLIGKKTPAGYFLQSSQEVASYFLAEAHVSAVPGEAFGMGNYIRFSYATALDQLEIAAKRMHRACSDVS